MIPAGNGVYPRATPAEYSDRYAWIAPTHARSDARARVRRAISRGQQAWLFSDPADWTPARWRVELPTIVGKARAFGATGIIADLENAWPGASESEIDAIALALSRLVDSGMPVGITVVPTARHIRRMAPTIAGKVWVGPQLYPQSPVSGTYPVSRLTEWQREFNAIFGADRVVPHVRLWTGAPESPDVTPARFPLYLGAILPARARAAWITSRPPGYMESLYLTGRSDVQSSNPATAAIVGGSAIGALLIVSIALFFYVRSRS